MVKNITRRLSLTTTCAIAVAMILVGQVAALAVPCQVPNVSTKGCYDPTDSIFACDNITNPSATTCTSGKTYAINQFPDGASDSATGATKTEQRNCYKSTPCSYSTDTMRCVPGVQSAWYLGNKVIPNPDVTCPTPG